MIHSVYDLSFFIFSRLNDKGFVNNADMDKMDSIFIVVLINLIFSIKVSVDHIDNNFKKTYMKSIVRESKRLRYL